MPRSPIPPLTPPSPFPGPQHSEPVPLMGGSPTWWEEVTDGRTSSFIPANAFGDAMVAATLVSQTCPNHTWQRREWSAFSSAALIVPRQADRDPVVCGRLCRCARRWTPS